MHDASLAIDAATLPDSCYFLEIAIDLSIRLSMRRAGTVAVLYVARPGRDPDKIRLFQHLRIDLRTLEVLPTIDIPLNNRDDEDDAKCNNAVVHVATGHWQERWEHKQNCREKRERDTDLSTVSEANTRRSTDSPDSQPSPRYLATGTVSCLAASSFLSGN